MKTIFIFLFTAIIIVCSSCKKFLDERSDASLALPSTLPDLQALLDRNSIFNAVHPAVGEASADDHWLTDAAYAALPTDGYKNAYTWGEELYYNQYPNDWSNIYSAVYAANTVMEALPSIPKTNNNQLQRNDIKGQALFHRARMFFITATLFAKAYDPLTAEKDLGIPLRLSTDFNIASTRATLKETYDRITKDVLESITILPVNAEHIMRPSKTAAYALAAKIYLSMGEYNKAGLYADSSLQLKSDLLDYNTISTTAVNSFAAYNKEVLFISWMPLTTNVNPAVNGIDTNLIAMYAANDLRKLLFFKDNGNKRFSFKGSYNGNTQPFTGLTTDETWLIRAECFARAGNKDQAMNDLNKLLKTRWKTNTYIDVTAATAQDALIKILTERRKELVMRDVRFSDLKRLNREPAFAVTIRRNLNGQLIELTPNSARYALPIPAVVIQQSGMQQNER
jgi:tetratricopeptide (TPR) repeat protein